MGLVSVARDLGYEWSLRIRTDASAAIGIRRRRGLGKIRHLATADLWIQERVRSGEFIIEKIAGENNVSDILTKYVERPLSLRHLKALGLRSEHGRAETAPTIENAIYCLQPGSSQALAVLS